MLSVGTQNLCLRAAILVASWTSTAAANNDEDPFAPESEQSPSSPESGPELGLRLGLATGAGEFETDRPVSEFVAGMLPLWVDAGYRLYNRWFLGFYWQYSLGLRSSTSRNECDDCVHSGIRYGLQVNYSLVRSPLAHVWAGLGVGRQSFETVNERTKRGTAYDGWEPVSVHLGSAWRPSLGVELGPFFSLAYGSMSTRSNVCYDSDRAGCPPEDELTLANGGTIWWSTVGIRASFLP